MIRGDDIRFLRRAVSCAVSLALALPATASACLEEKGYDATLNARSPQAIVDRAEVIVEGVLYARGSVSRPSGDTIDVVQFMKMRITHVWKGDVGPEITVYLDDFSGGCRNWPPMDVPIRLAGPLEDGNVLHYGALFGAYGVPIGDPTVDQALIEYERTHRNQE